VRREGRKQGGESGGRLKLDEEKRGVIGRGARGGGEGRV